MGGDLVNLHSSAENTLVKSKLEHMENYWIGLTKSGAHWKWTDGSIMDQNSFTDWDSCCPSGDADCANMFGVFQHKWSDQWSCELSMSYICEIPRGNGAYKFLVVVSVREQFLLLNLQRSHNLWQT